MKLLPRLLSGGGSKSRSRRPKRGGRYRLDTGDSTVVVDDGASGVDGSREAGGGKEVLGDIPENKMSGTGTGPALREAVTESSSSSSSASSAASDRSAGNNGNGNGRDNPDLSGFSSSAVPPPPPLPQRRAHAGSFEPELGAGGGVSPEKTIDQAENGDDDNGVVVIGEKAHDDDQSYGCSDAVLSLASTFVVPLEGDSSAEEGAVETIAPSTEGVFNAEGASSCGRSRAAKFAVMDELGIRQPAEEVWEDANAAVCQGGDEAPDFAAAAQPSGDGGENDHAPDGVVVGGGPLPRLTIAEDDVSTVTIPLDLLPRGAYRLGRRRVGFHVNGAVAYPEEDGCTYTYVGSPMGRFEGSTMFEEEESDSSLVVLMKYLRCMGGRRCFGDPGAALFDDYNDHDDEGEVGSNIDAGHENLDGRYPLRLPSGGVVIEFEPGVDTPSVCRARKEEERRAAAAEEAEHERRRRRRRRRARSEGGRGGRHRPRRDSVGGDRDRDKKEEEDKTGEGNHKREKPKRDCRAEMIAPIALEDEAPGENGQDGKGGEDQPLAVAMPRPTAGFLDAMRDMICATTATTPISPSTPTANPPPAAVVFVPPPSRQGSART